MLRKSIWRVMGRMVCQLGGSLKYRVYSRPVDMRKSFRGLAGIVHSEIGRQLSPEDVYVFVGKNRRTLKLLQCVISYATFVKMAIGERLWGTAKPY